MGNEGIAYALTNKQTERRYKTTRIPSSVVSSFGSHILPCGALLPCFLSTFALFLLTTPSFVSLSLCLSGCLPGCLAQSLIVISRHVFRLFCLSLSTFLSFSSLSLFRSHHSIVIIISFHFIATTQRRFQAACERLLPPTFLAAAPRLDEPAARDDNDDDGAGGSTCAFACAAKDDGGPVWTGGSSGGGAAVTPILAAARRLDPPLRDLAPKLVPVLTLRGARAPPAAAAEMGFMDGPSPRPPAAG